jgi:hypothetical protein
MGRRRGSALSFTPAHSRLQSQTRITNKNKTRTAATGSERWDRLTSLVASGTDEGRQSRIASEYRNVNMSIPSDYHTGDTLAGSSNRSVQPSKQSDRPMISTNHNSLMPINPSSRLQTSSPIPDTRPYYLHTCIQTAPWPFTLPRNHQRQILMGPCGSIIWATRCENRGTG